MPSKYTLENLPEPANKTISFRKVGKHRVAALRFSGNLNIKSAMRKANELKTWLVENKYSKKGDFVFAQYNPPWIPGIFRRNEVLIEVWQVVVRSSVTASRREEHIYTRRPKIILPVVNLAGSVVIVVVNGLPTTPANNKTTGGLLEQY